MTETPKTTVPETNKAATQTPAEGATVQTTSNVPNTDDAAKAKAVVTEAQTVAAQTIAAAEAESAAVLGKSAPTEHTVKVRVIAGKHAHKDAKGVVTVYKVGETLEVSRPLYDTFRNKFELVD